ncbi:MAG: hypothetical protein ACI936_000921 [Paraglaciecola sp.]|jgi:hypothetical protein
MLISKLKNVLSKMVVRLLRTEMARAELAAQQAKKSQRIANLTNVNSPYAEPFPSSVSTKTCERDDIIFISSRFRSGSTVLWNMFRQDPNHTTYYEPFNERKWFSQKHRGESVDATHFGVKDYSAEFDNMEDLDHLYEQSWIHRNLHMDETSWDPKMKEFICQLVERSKGRPVLQFNRVDFRLPWLRHNFPNAKFLHLYRHPRDQWLSFLTDKKSMNKDSVQDTYQDAFYLNSWCEDLSQHFPFLSIKSTPHPYQRFYYLWKLSFLYGQKYADLSISFEDLVQSKEQTTEKIIKAFSLNTDAKSMYQVLETPQLNRWESYADEQWFKKFEDECEYNLNVWLHSLNRE